ncbi:MAG: hypothetical protein IJC11_04435 [Alphaproteobacteria bacterium]|nr:hypothetical protein [Alphaproteobacteria bacterium]MBR3913921.1 hypothetical protein [Alphaproteobacteria bacterium]
MTDLSTYDILNDIRNGKTPVKRQNPQAGESPYYYIQSNGDKSYLPITEKNIINVNSADEPNPLWSSAFQKTTNTGSNEATQTSVADSVLSGTFDTSQTNSLGTNSTQTDNLDFNSASSTNNTMSLFDTPQTMSSILGTSSSGSVNPFGTSSFQPDNSSFSNTINNYFTPKYLSENAVYDTMSTVDENAGMSHMGGYTSGQYTQTEPFLMTETERADADLKRAIYKFEDPKSFPYKDSEGNITWCVGHMDNTDEGFLSQPWQDEQGNLVDMATKRKALNDLRNSVNNYKADYYKKITNLRLPQWYCNELYQKDVNKFRNQLSRKVPNYNLMPRRMQNSLVENHYTTGSVNIESKWPKLYQAAREFNQQELCNNIARTTESRPDMIERNAWGLNECLQDDFIQK